MPILNVVLILIAVGVLLWLVNTYIPMARPIKTILNAVVVIAVVIWLLKIFGVWGSVSAIHTDNVKAPFLTTEVYKSLAV